MPKRALEYQIQRGERSGQAYKIGETSFDAFRDGKLIEAKGEGYDTFVDKNGKEPFQDWFKKANTLRTQAQAQLAASRATGVPLQWEVAEQRFAKALRTFFDQNGLKEVPVVWVPFKR